MRSKLTILALALGLLGMGGSMDQLNLVILSPDNGFTEVLEPDVAISQTGGSGPLRGTNLEFSCGSCSVATFEDAIPRLGGGENFFLCDGMKPRDLVTNEAMVCVRSTLTGNRSNVDLETWGGSGTSGCTDADGGQSCTATGGRTSYLRGPLLCDPLRGLIDKVEDLDLHKGTANSLVKKLRNAGRALCDDNTKNDRAAANALGAFIHKVEAQSGKKIAPHDAAELIAAAQAILAELDVPSRDHDSDDGSKDSGSKDSKSDGSSDDDSSGKRKGKRGR